MSIFGCVQANEWKMADMLKHRKAFVQKEEKNIQKEKNLANIVVPIYTISIKSYQS
jgi:hypothetical protein